MNPSELLPPVAVGLAAGYLSGQFGIGGGLVTTPAIRLLLGYPALIAVGTPLLVVLPTAVTGAVAYARRGLVDARAGLVIGAAGAAASVAGAFATRLVGGATVLVVTAAVILWMAVDMVLLALRDEPRGPEEAPSVRRHVPARHRLAGLVVLGVVTGLYSGFLGLGGGFVVVPSLVRWFGVDIKRALGTSLIVVAVLAVPGSITHYALGNIDLKLAGLLALGVVPGALLGAKVAARAQARTLKIAFAALLVVVGIVLGASEIGLL